MCNDIPFEYDVIHILIFIFCYALLNFAEEIHTSMSISIFHDKLFQELAKSNTVSPLVGSIKLMSMPTSIISPNHHHLKQKDAIAFNAHNHHHVQSSPNHKHKRGVKKNLNTTGLAQEEPKNQMAFSNDEDRNIQGFLTRDHLTSPNSTIKLLKVL